MARYRVVETARAKVSEAQMEGVFAKGFPKFIVADQEVKKYISRVREYFSDFDILLLDEGGGPVATGWGVPLRWDGEAGTLPATFADVLQQAVEAHEARHTSDTFVICGGVVHPEMKGTGAAAALIRALIECATGQGLSKVVAPLRPTRKHLYPLVNIKKYAAWTREDGQAFDPWLRLHQRVGGRVVALATGAQTMTGTVNQWQEWTGLSFPEDGSYVIPAGLSLLDIDRTSDMGTYVEPNIWVRHR